MFVELSAKTGTNINTLFKTVVSLLPKSKVDEETQKCTCRLLLSRRHSDQYRWGRFVFKCINLCLLICLLTNTCLRHVDYNL